MRDLTHRGDQQAKASTGPRPSGPVPNELPRWVLRSPHRPNSASPATTSVPRPLPRWSNPVGKCPDRPSRTSPTSSRRRFSGAILWTNPPRGSPFREVYLELFWTFDPLFFCIRQYADWPGFPSPCVFPSSIHKSVQCIKMKGKDGQHFLLSLGDYGVIIFEHS